jgi:hypothetical protein
MVVLDLENALGPLNQLSNSKSMSLINFVYTERLYYAIDMNCMPIECRDLDHDAGRNAYSMKKLLASFLPLLAQS